MRVRVPPGPPMEFKMKMQIKFDKKDVLSIVKQYVYNEINVKNIDNIELSYICSFGKDGLPDLDSVVVSVNESKID